MNEKDNAAFDKRPSEIYLEELEIYDFRDNHGHPLRNCIIFRQMLAELDQLKNPADI